MLVAKASDPAHTPAPCQSLPSTRHTEPKREDVYMRRKHLCLFDIFVLMNKYLVNILHNISAEFIQSPSCLMLLLFVPCAPFVDNRLGGLSYL